MKQLPDSLKDILELNDFSDNESLIDSELDEIDTLYTDSKKILDDYLNTSSGPTRLGASKTPRSSMFIASQTTNLISLKQLKLNYFKEKNTLKDKQLDKYFKVLNVLEKQKVENDKSEVNEHVLKYIMDHLNMNIPVTINEKIVESINAEQLDIDALLLQRVSDINVDTITGNNTDEEEVIEDGTLVMDTDRNVYEYTNDDFILLSNDKYIITALEDGTYIDTITGKTINLVE